ncbi:MAG: papain-like cysteine protease family protein [Lachnospirales bacterium]
MKSKKILAIGLSIAMLVGAVPNIAQCAGPTRENVITSIYNISNKKNLNSNSNKATTFKDWSDVSENAQEAMIWAINNGIISGYNDSTLRPKQEITEQEYNTIISKANEVFDKNTGNYTNEMKMEKKVDLSPEDGPDSVERMGDHKNSPYYSTLDFYNMKSTDSLTILHNFKTYQQTSEFSCGVACTYMVMNWFNKADNYDEKILEDMRSDHSSKHIGTCLEQMKDMFNGVGGFNYITTLDNNTLDKDTIQNYLKNGIPIIVGWNDFGGHWQVIIGYDDMGTPDYQLDDVIIVADPYDTGDHNQDGYGVYQWARFINNFTFYNFFPDDEVNDNVYIVAYPEEMSSNITSTK